MSGSDLRLVPIAVAVWLGLLAALSGSPLVAALAAVSFVIIGVGAGRIRRGRWLLVAVAATGLVALGLGGLREHLLVTSVPGRLAAEQAVAVIELQTVGDPERLAQTVPSGSVLVRVPATTRVVAARGSTWRVRQRVTVLITGDQTGFWLAVPAGARLRVVGRLVPADPGTGEAAVVRIRGPSLVLDQPSASWRLTGRVRAGLRDAVGGLPPERRALVPALVVGDTSALTEDLNGRFRASGLSHLNAVSGANLALMLVFVLSLARWLGVRGWWLRLIGAACVLAFVAICRTEPSVLRAAAMGVVVLAGLGFGSVGGSLSATDDDKPSREEDSASKEAAAQAGTDPGRSTTASGAAAGRGGLIRMAGFRPLALAVVILLLADPWLCRSVGFALSVLATAGIVALARRWTDIAAAHLPDRVPRWLLEAITVPLAAQTATQAVVTAISGQVSVVGIVANALAGPCVGPATVLGFAAAGVSLVSRPLAAVLGWCAGWPAQVIIWIATASAALPGAVWHLPVGPAVVVGVAAASVVVAGLMPRLLRHPWLVAVALAALVIVLLRPPVHPGWPPKGWVVVACDIGQGDALVIDLGDHQAAVIDTGPEPGPIDQCLDELGVRVVPLLVLTHFHADHVGGLAAVASGRSVGLVLVSPLASPPAEAAIVGRLVAASPGAQLQTARVGAPLDVGRLHWLTIGPVRVVDAPAAGVLEDAESSAQNDGSIVGIATITSATGPPLRILFTGDVEPDGQRAILATGVSLAVDVLKVPHHGSSRQEQSFLAATGARIAITSSGFQNGYGHPAASTVRRLEQLGMTVLRTDLDGGVAVWVDDGEVGATVQR